MFLWPATRSYRYSYVIQTAALMPLLPAVFMACVLRHGQLSETVWLIAIALPAVTGIGLFAAFRRQQITIYQEGIGVRSVLGSKEIRWEDVVETRYSQTTVSQELVRHLGLLGLILMPFVGQKSTSKKGSQTLKVLSREGVRITASSNYKDVKEAIRTVMERVHPRLLDEARRRVQQGDTVQFGKLAVSPMGVSWRSKSVIPYSSIADASISGSNFRIKVEGKWLDAVSVRCQNIPNVFVVVDLIRERRSGTVGVEASSFATTV